MPLLPYLILSENGNIADCSDFFEKGICTDSKDEIERYLIDSLADGDLADLIRFCRSGFSDNHDNFKIIPLVDFYSFNYLFLEKNSVSDRVINAAFFGHDIFDFADLISPSSAVYQSVSGRCIGDILGMKSDDRLHDGVTPEMLLISENFPEIRNEILYGNLKNQYCDISVVISSILDAIKEDGLYPYAQVSVDFSEAPPKSNRNHRISVCTFVYLFAAVMSLLSVISEDHRIDITVDCHPCYAEILFSVGISSDKFENGTYSSLDILGDYAGCHSILVKAASAIAFSSGITTSVDLNDGRLKTVVTLDFFAESKTGFNYNDPYSDIGSMVARVIGYINSIDSIKKVAG